MSQTGGLSRLPGMRISKPTPGLWARLVLGRVRAATRQLTGKDVTPDSMQAAAWHPGLLTAVSGMEMAQAGLRSVDPAVKVLASAAASRWIGCPF